MHPRSECDLEIVADNARAWSAFCGVPVRAVVKCDGYNWGAERIVRALEDICPAFCVADADELHALRPHTLRPIIVLGEIGTAQIADALDADGIPTIATRDDVAAVRAWAQRRGRRPLVRVGVLPAAGWSGLDLPELRAFAPMLAAAELDVEVWTHLTDASVSAAQTARLHEGTAILRGAGVNVAATDVAATAAAACRDVTGDFTRIGVGLFGATGGTAVPGVRCALRLDAPEIRSETHPAGRRLGYGTRSTTAELATVTVRCGYGDGFPNVPGALDDILSGGMQYTTLRAAVSGANGWVSLLRGDSDLDALAARTNRDVHEIVTTLGLANRRERMRKANET